MLLEVICLYNFKTHQVALLAVISLEDAVINTEILRVTTYPELLWVRLATKP